VIDRDLFAAVRCEAGTDAPAKERARRAAELIRARTDRRWVGIYRRSHEPRLERTRTTRTSHLLRRSRAHRRRDPLPQHGRLERRCHRFPLLTNQESTGSELIVPVLLGRRVVGTLDIENAATGAFDEKDQALFEELAATLTDLYD
jgi:GAF domain-containing protein